MSSCDAEMCQYWAGMGCVCEAFGIGVYGEMDAEHGLGACTCCDYDPGEAP